MKKTSRQPARSLRRASRAFTLMEILIVVAIIGLLVGVAVTNLDSVLGSNEKKIASLFVNQSIKPAMTQYRIQMGDYPSTAEGLQALISAPAGKEASWSGPYLEKLPLDPWKQPYVYQSPGTHNKNSYDLFSKGPDKTEGTADDIGNWETTAPAQ
ncbi:MAG: type II secretion system major pseudopilin GspG [Opitutaceae bacterium]|jgi:general secretion pathway protein G|nr:type II secretion system major pseudopilin GspG [Opitutaceae bacterium]